MANQNIYFKKDFNRLVMNITQTIFSTTKCAYIRLIKVSYKRKFVVLSSANIKNTLMQN